MVTRQQAFEILAALRPAEVFLDAYRLLDPYAPSPGLPEQLDIFCGVPEEFFLSPESQALYTGGVLVPILDDGNFSLVTFWDPATGTLLQKYVEEPEVVQARFRSWQQYLAALFFSIAESVDEEARLRRIARLCEFHYEERAVALWREAEHLTYDEYLARQQSLLAEMA